jgi:hypothetical protein
MKEYQDIHDDEIRIIGHTSEKAKLHFNKTTITLAVACVVLIITLCVWLRYKYHSAQDVSYFETETNEQNHISNQDTSALSGKGYIKISEVTVNDVPMYIYTPHHAIMTLSVGLPDKNDSTLLFVAQAADIRKDTKKIVGDFVMNGQKLSFGQVKLGFCAIIHGKITLGTAPNTPLLQEAIDTKGYFFRQYPLVKEGELIENNPKNKAIRRALGIKQGQIIMIESRSSESFHDFTQALIDFGINNAIYLVGGNAFGWCYDQHGNRIEFGVEQNSLPPQTSYIIWRSR